MTTAEIIDVESTALEVVPVQPVALFGTTDPVEIVAKARDVANALKDVLKVQGMVSNISGKEYVKCEGWTLLGSMLGVFPVEEWCRPVDGPPGPKGEPHGWEARVEARSLSGAVVGAAEAMCTRSEKSWSGRDDFALRSMAQTRATSKALRMPLGFVVTLAGYSPTPAEEMDFSSKPIPGGQERGFKQQTKPETPTPLCPTHQHECNWVPAGKSKKTGNTYGSFYVCPDKTCSAGDNGRPWSIFSSDWDDQLHQKEQLAQPSQPMVEPDAVPFE